MSIATVEADLLTYSDYEEVGSVSRAKTFMTNAKKWLIQKPTSASNQSSSLSLRTEAVEQMLADARAYVQANDTSPTASRVRFLQPGGSFR